MIRKPIRKPKDIYMNKPNELYAGFEDFCYIGGSYYNHTARVHLKHEEEVHALAKYLTKLSKWLNRKKSKGAGV